MDNETTTGIESITAPPEQQPDNPGWITKLTQQEMRNSGPVSCADCGKPYANAWGLEVHRRQNHGPNGPLRWKRGTRKPVKLAAAGKATTGMLGIGYKKSPTKCPECGKKFKNGRAVIVHHRQVHDPRGGWSKVKKDKRPLVETVQEPRQKRKYTKRINPVLVAQPLNKMEEPPPVGVQFCPCCGTNLAGVAMALKLTNR